VRARKRFGQHFLEPAWVDKVVTAIAPSPDDTFLEIGPGPGALTLALAPRVARLVAIEIDRDLAPALAARVPGHVTVLEADFLAADVAAAVDPFAPVRVAGNLPYNVSTPILARLLELSAEGRRLRDATVMLQLEVARRLDAEPGTKDWGVLSACQQLRADVELLLTLPPGAFRPAPKVQSAVVRLRYRPPVVPVSDVARFESLVRTLFMQRRKMLSNGLAPFAAARGMDPRDAIARAGLEGRRRPETLTLAELARLSDVFVSA
jgi:16S rRNA (adenine1518-N6/adenine1519-N6)-dimethyltransferase